MGGLRDPQGKFAERPSGEVGERLRHGCERVGLLDGKPELIFDDATVISLAISNVRRSKYGSSAWSTSGQRDPGIAARPRSKRMTTRELFGREPGLYPAKLRTKLLEARHRLHILLNYHWDSRALLSLVLVGLPELRDCLALRRNRSLHSRLHHRLEIASLSASDTAEYIRMRLRRAGCDRELFASDAVGLLHEATAGAMRDLDRLAAAALRETARRKRRLVERDVAARVIEEDTRERDR